MPIEIRELTIKVNVNQDQNKTSAGNTAGGQSEHEEKESVIREAVEEAVRIIENKKER